MVLDIKCKAAIEFCGDVYARVTRCVCILALALGGLLPI
jgi:hypothetical protein